MNNLKNNHNCTICNSTNIKKLRKIKSPVNQLFYTFKKCLACNSYFFDINEHEYDLISLYDNYADTSSLDTPFKRSLYWNKQIIIIKSLKKDINNVIDIGCRTGDFLMHWDEKIDKEGVELSKKSASIAKKRGLVVHENFIEKIIFEGKRFDVVSTFAVLEHIEHPEIVLDSLTKITNDNGILLIMVPYFGSFKAKFLYLMNYNWHMFSQPLHLNFYSKSYLDNYMANKGFVLRKTLYTSGGLFNPFVKVPLIGRAFNYVMGFLDYYTPLSRLPIFDHMYLYYQKK